MKGMKIFEPIKIGNMELSNRFVRSATCENSATENGYTTDAMMRMYVKLSRGEIGLIVLGYMYVHPLGRAFKYQTGIHSDGHISGIKAIVDLIHRNGGNVAVQLSHAGPQTYPQLIKTTPLGPSKKIMNPFTFSHPKEMSEEDIEESVQFFIDAAKRAIRANFDAIQLHACHGYLINQFLSPYFNVRQDKWGGTDENRFRYLKRIILGIKKIIPNDIPIIIKLNAHDHTPKEGIIPSLAAKYSEWLVDLGIKAIEISTGTNHYSLFHVVRGEIPVKEIVQWLPNGLRDSAEEIFRAMKGKYDLIEGYNLEAAKMIKPKIGNIPLILVGGLRTVSFIEEIIAQNYVNMVSLCRPFIREPSLIKHIKKGKIEKVKCVSCNRCVAALPNDIPVKCYLNKWPNKL
jgi:2,4-dienoyl-CoA reductase-like NADH-dependent reductase (Old Yellow Enzyme family)